MMQKIKLLCVFLCALPVLAVAVTRPDNLETLEEVKPPPNTLENPTAADESIEPQITIRKKGGESIEEYRINGELYMMKVTPAHGVPYYLHKEDSSGGWINDGPNKPLSVPKWILFRF